MRGRIFDLTDPDDREAFNEAVETSSTLVRQLYEEGNWTVEVAQRITAALGTQASVSDFDRIGGRMLMLGKFNKPIILEPEDTTPRDSKGRKMSARAIRYGEYRVWSATASMTEVTKRRQTDPDFAAFYRSERSNEVLDAGDGVEAGGTMKRDVDKKKWTQELNDFANAYRRMSSEQADSLRKAATNPGGAAGAAEFNRLVDECIEAGAL